MMKLSRFLLQSRSHFGSSIHAKDSMKLYAFTSQAKFSTSVQNYASKERIFAPYSVFKGKAALSFQPVMPTFAKLESGHHRIGRRGVMLLTFMPAVGERKYDYEKRQHFALSATEMGSVMSLGPTDSSEFFHDPSMLSSNAGQVRKSLSIKPISSDGSGGYFVSLSVVNNILKFNDRFNVPLTTAEFTVLKTACSFALPYIMGWDQLIGKLPEGMATNFLKVMAPKPAVADRGRPDLEWDR